MKKILIIAFLSLANIAHSQNYLNLDSAIRITLENNYSIMISNKSVEIADNNFAPGPAGMLPRLDLQGGMSYSIQDIENEIAGGQQIIADGVGTQQYNYGAELGWTLFDGLGMFIRYDRLSQLRDQSNIELQIAIEETLRNLINSYYNAKRLKREILIAEENIKLTRDRLERAEIKKEFGGTSLEVLRAKVDYNTDSTIYLQTKLAYDNAIRGLNFILGRSINSNYDIDTLISITSLEEYDEIWKKTIEANNSISNALKQKKISELDHDLVMASMWPRIQGSASYSYNRSEADEGFLTVNKSQGFQFGISASVNVFNGFQTQINRQNAKIAKEMNEIAYNQIKSSIELQLRNAYETAQRRLEIYQMQEINLKTAELNYSRTQDLFELGNQTSIELRDAQLNLLRAKQAILNALIDLKLSQLEIELISNQLLK